MHVLCNCLNLPADQISDETHVDCNFLIPFWENRIEKNFKYFLPSPEPGFNNELLFS